MNILNFLIKNWSDMLVITIILIGVITAVSKWVGPLNKMTAAEKIAYVTRLLMNLAPIALMFVTEAEAEFGGGTGCIKRSYVISKLYDMIPDPYKIYVTEENLDALLTKALEEARKLWASADGTKTVIISTGAKYVIPTNNS